MSVAAIFLSPFRWSRGDIPEIHRWLTAIHDGARPVPGIVCLVVVGLFLIQGLRCFKKARSATRVGGEPPQRCRWLLGAIAADFVLAFAWLALLALELFYPEAKEPAAPKPSPVETRL